MPKGAELSYGMENFLRVLMDSRAMVCYMKFGLHGQTCVKSIFAGERRVDF